ncbi:MAG: 2-methylaconitate cis-trans isomerase PrpF family protein [Bacillota bacterium]|nr:3-methylitaconate isomerase [Clostridia bacterium]
MREYEKIRTAIIRGGTSKGVYLLESDLPADPSIRDQVIMSIYGTPDARQINGLGGADPLTSKVALIKRSSNPDADVDYTFGYVGIADAHIDYSGNCGNISSGVGPFAIDEGLVPAVEPFTKVRIFNTNTKKLIEAEVPVKDGKAVTEGDFSIDGVPGTGAKILLNFLKSGGAKTGKLLPTGNRVDEITLKDGRKVKVSIVDAATPAVFARATDLGFTGTELPEDTQSKPEILDVMEEIRCICAEMIGLATSRDKATEETPAVPKVMIVAPPQDCVTSEGRQIAKDSIDLVARTKALAVMHKAFAVTGGICTATAALIEGTVVNDVVGDTAKATGSVRIGHPGGILEFGIELEVLENGELFLKKAAVARTARRIMDGFVYVPAKIYWAKK